MAMNFARLIGDWLHTVSILMILHRLFVVKNAQGVSRKTQELCLLTFLLRYMDLFTTFYGPYNSLLKIYYILASAACVYVLTLFSNHAAAQTYYYEQDHVPHWKLIVLPCLIAGAASTLNLDWMEWMWTASLYLEMCACIPQIVMFRKYRQVESLTGGSFILLMGAYRGCYFVNWIIRMNTERGFLFHYHWLSMMTGLLQFAVCFLGVFWPVQNGEEEPAPLLPQLIQFCGEIRSAKSGAVLSGTACIMLGGIFQGVEHHMCSICWSALVVTTLSFTGFVIRMWQVGDLEKKRDKICAVLSCADLWSVLLGAPFAVIFFLLLSCFLVLCFYPEHPQTENESSARLETENDSEIHALMDGASINLEEDNDRLGSGVSGTSNALAEDIELPTILVV